MGKYCLVTMATSGIVPAHLRGCSDTALLPTRPAQSRQVAALLAKGLKEHPDVFLMLLYTLLCIDL